MSLHAMAVYIIYNRYVRTLLYAGGTYATNSNSNDFKHPRPIILSNKDC